jgi:lysophospholipase L1-like esterase
MEEEIPKTIRPRKVFFIVIYIQLFLLLFVLLMPDGEWKLTDGFSLHFVPLQQVLHGKEHTTKNIKHLVTSVQVDSAENEEESFALISIDSAFHPADTTTEFNLQHGRNNADDLNTFFEALHQCAQQGSPLAVAYYGDSQVEGDRFSDYLRNKLQKQFGGGGPGLVTPIDVSTMRITVQQRESREWIKQACYGYPQSKVNESRYGISGAMYSYRNGYLVTKKVAKDSTGADSVLQSVWVSSGGLPWLSFKRSKLSYATVKNYDRATLWYASQRTVQLRVEKNGGILSDTISAAEVGTKTWSTTDSSGYIKLTFISGQSPDIMGVSLDRENGVRVDNYSMRGSSGTDFTRMNGPYLAKQHQLRGTKFIILQYGVNVVPYVKDSQAVQYYEYSFLKQLQLLKRQLPGVSILVVGTTDISTKEGTDYATYPYLEMIRDAQRRAAFAAGCAFWDAYEAMGGKNSMPLWVFNNPPLAAKDFTHLSPRGANLLAELLYKAIMKDYQRYLKAQGS